MGFRNYHRGFTRMTIAGGSGVFMLNRDGHGVTDPGAQRWDDDFTASDTRARFKPTPNLAGAADAHTTQRHTDSDHTRDDVQRLLPFAARKTSAEKQAELAQAGL